MKKVAAFFVRCKSSPTAPVQNWIPHMSGIYSECKDCGAYTGYGQTKYNEHYDLFQIVMVKEKGMDYDALYDYAEQIVNADPSKYQVAKFTDELDLTKQRMKNGAKYASRP